MNMRWHRGSRSVHRFPTTIDEWPLADLYSHTIKLHLHPKSMKVSGPGKPGTKLEIPPLPNDVTLSQIYSDFIKYLYNRTMDFFVENTPNGRNIWNRLKSKIALVFCTPNGWEISQQIFVRDATKKPKLYLRRRPKIESLLSPKEKPPFTMCSRIHEVISGSIKERCLLL
jgi:hypothetical protein